MADTEDLDTVSADDAAFIWLQAAVQEILDLASARPAAQGVGTVAVETIALERLP